MLLAVPPKAFTTKFFVNSYKYSVPFSTFITILSSLLHTKALYSLLNMSDSFCGFLSATPNSTHNSHAAPKITALSSSIAQPYCICTNCNHLLTFNHHVGHVAEEGTSNKGSNVQQQQQQSSRWSPTPVQLLVLEELYRKGMKTPSAEQIQQIASQLRQFGKIEGKNVFYWFQNHKARERQKRRRREIEETASSPEGLKETGCGVKETKKWASTSNCSEVESTGALDIAVGEKGSTSTRWAQNENENQIEERDMQVLRKNIAAEAERLRHAKCQNIMEMTCCFFPPFTTTMPTTNRTRKPHHHLPSVVLNNNRESFNYYYEEQNADPPRTLDLFPLKRDIGQLQDHNDICLTQTKSMETDQISSSEQFFEFLPLRN